MLHAFKNIIGLLDRSERRRFYSLIVASIVMALIDVISLASIIPFLAIIADPAMIQERSSIRGLYDGLGFADPGQFMLFFGVCIFAFVMFGIFTRALTFHFIMQFTRLRAVSFAMRLLERYLAQPYAWHLNRHSADLSRQVLDEVKEVVNGPLSAFMRLIANACAGALLIGLLIALEPVAASMALVVLGLCYGSVFLYARRRVSELGREWRDSNATRYKVLQEALSGLREVKFFGLERAYLDRFRAPSQVTAERIARIQTIAEMPRHVLEAIAFGGMLLFINLMLFTGRAGLQDIVPLLGIYAFAGIRLFPLVQHIYTGYTEVIAGIPVLEGLSADLKRLSPLADRLPNEQIAEPFRLQKALFLENITYTYPGAERPALDDISLSIAAGTTVGFVGKTGAGKTTLVDLLLGLLRADTGRLRRDGVPIDLPRMETWRRSIGYVPQSIFLTDGSIAANIAFGSRDREINIEKVRRAALAAKIDDHVRSLPEGYDTEIGERGVKLSGGQRQRLGIARALYDNPDIIVFDEATSALDGETERAVMESIHRLGGQRTLIIVAHRLTTLGHCDVVHMLAEGRLVASGRLNELAAEYPELRLSMTETA
ncbi:MAG: ABC transporter ATP-binding protein [Pacificimonas sp.]